MDQKRGCCWFAFAALTLCLVTSASLQAETINFSDLGPGCSPAIPANYHGLTWSSNFQVECNADYASSYGNSYGAPSGFAVTNGGALGSGVSMLSIATGTFNFLGAEFSAFAGSDTFQFFSAESLAIYGFKPGDAPDTPTFTTFIDLNPTGYDFIPLNYTGVDLVLFGAGTGPATDPSTVFGGQRYANCGNGTVTDSATGLIWLKDAARATLGTPGFAPANNAAAALHNRQCGLTDGSAAGNWRLPSRAEWLTTLQGPQGLIAQFSPSCPAPPLKANDGTSCFQSVTQGSGLHQHAFLNVVSGGYWTSSTYELDPTYAYLVDLSQTSVASSGAILPHFQVNALTLNVWPVRGGSK